MGCESPTGKAFSVHTAIARGTDEKLDQDSTVSPEQNGFLRPEMGH